MLVKYSERPETKMFGGAVGTKFDDSMGTAGPYQSSEPQICKGSRLPAPFQQTLIDKNDRKLFLFDQTTPKRPAKREKNHTS